MHTTGPTCARGRVAMVAAALLPLAAYADPGAAALLGEPAPDFVLKSVSGANLRLSEYRGEVVMLSFWASGCGDCRAQLRELDDWHETYRGAGLRLLAVSLDRDADDVADTADALDLGYPVLHDADRRVAPLYDVRSMPLCVLVDRDGVVREVNEGFSRAREQAFLERVKALLRE